MAHSPCFYLPLPVSPSFPCVPFYFLGTLLAVTGIIPHLGLRLLVNWPPLPHLSPKPSPFQIPWTPTAQRLTKTTSGIFRLLLSRTLGVYKTMVKTAKRNVQTLLNLQVGKKFLLVTCKYKIFHQLALCFTLFATLLMMTSAKTGILLTCQLKKEVFISFPEAGSWIAN